MTLEEFLNHIRSLDIRVWAEGDRLRFNAPAGALTPELKAELARRKSEILEYFAQANQPAQVIRRAARQGAIPASYAQQRLWFIQQLEPAGYVYNVKVNYCLRGPLVLDVLELSLQEIIRRHEALRTTLAEQGGELVQVISPPPADPPALIRLTDLRDVQPVERQARALALLQESARRPFDLSSGPLMRVTAVRLKDEEHLLQVVMHHVVTDGWSMGVFMDELSRLYNALRQGRPSPLAELPVQYADYALWQRGWLQGDVLHRQMAYWKGQLDGANQALNLPADFPRPPVQSYNGARVEFELEEHLGRQLAALGSSENATLFMTLLSALALLLYRTAGQDDILIGSPVANRRHKELENLIGFFVNTLVLRIDLSGSPTFRQLLRRARQAALDAYDHQDLPFEQLIHELNPRRDASRSPLFQVMFALQEFQDNAQDQALGLAGVQAERLLLESDTAHYEWTWFIERRGGKLGGRLAYHTDLFSAAAMRLVIERFKALLAYVAAHPDQEIDQIPLLDEIERRRILVEWNATQRDYPRELCIHQLFERQAAQSADTAAVVYGEQSLTYAQLNRRANRLVWRLHRLGVGPDALVGLCLERSVDMVVAMLGILKAGAAYVPLDPAYPVERLAFMLQDTAARVVVSKRRWIAALPQAGLEILLLDQEQGGAGEDEDNPPNLAAPENLAYVMYTSGSTGVPKGICIPHRAVNRLVLNTDYVALRPGDRIAQASNVAFDAATFEIWGALLNGACLVGIDQQTLLSPFEFAATLRRQRIDVLFLTTALFNQVVALAPDAFASLRDLLFGGEMVTPHWVRQALHAGAPQRLLHVYGPTENTTFSTWHRIEAVAENAVTIPIGRPVANTTLYILDARLNPLPVGLPGEIYLGGNGLGRGYHARPELTAEKFIPDPFHTAQDGSSRLYRTGDRGRFLPDGSVEILGRLDDQVKLRGFRVELGEIEAFLAAHPAVAQAAVLLQTVIFTVEDDSAAGAPGDKRLAAYVVLKPGKKLNADELRAYLKARLPAYMIPSAFVFLAALPLTPNGKVDRRRLPLPEAESAPHRAESEAQNALQRQLAYIWETTLGVKPVGIHDNFFDLGGHSLLAARVFTQIEQRLGVRLPLATLFQSPTVAELADALSRAPDSRGWATLVPIQPQGAKPPFFCVHNFGGEVVNYADLAARLGKDQPFYGLQAQGIDGVKAPHATLPEMAAFYIEQMRQVQPQGPYSLGGYCFGGVVAYEMACQLYRQGQQVALLALMDSSPPRRSLPPELRRGSHRLGNFLRNLPQWIYDFLRSGEVWLVIRRKLRLAGKQTARKLGRAVEVTPFDIIGDAVRTESLPHKQLMDVHMRALWEYHTPQYPGKVTLFRIGRMPLFRAIEYDFGWGLFAQGGVDVQIVPGAHYNLLEEPHVRALAGKLAESLERSQC